MNEFEYEALLRYVKKYNPLKIKKLTLKEVEEYQIPKKYDVMVSLENNNLKYALAFSKSDSESKNLGLNRYIDFNIKKTEDEMFNLNDNKDNEDGAWKLSQIIITQSYFEAIMNNKPKPHSDWIEMQKIQDIVEGKFKEGKKAKEIYIQIMNELGCYKEVKC